MSVANKQLEDVNEYSLRTQAQTATQNMRNLMISNLGLILFSKAGAGAAIRSDLLLQNTVGENWGLEEGDILFSESFQENKELFRRHKQDLIDLNTRITYGALAFQLINYGGTAIYNFRKAAAEYRGGTIDSESALGKTGRFLTSADRVLRGVSQAISIGVQGYALWHRTQQSSKDIGRIKNMHEAIYYLRKQNREEKMLTTGMMLFTRMPLSIQAWNVMGALSEDQESIAEFNVLAETGRRSVANVQELMESKARGADWGTLGGFAFGLGSAALMFRGGAIRATLAGLLEAGTTILSTMGLGRQMGLRFGSNSYLSQGQKKKERDPWLSLTSDLIYNAGLFTLERLVIWGGKKITKASQKAWQEYRRRIAANEIRANKERLQELSENRKYWGEEIDQNNLGEELKNIEDESYEYLRKRYGDGDIHKNMEPPIIEYGSEEGGQGQPSVHLVKKDAQGEQVVEVGSYDGTTIKVNTKYANTRGKALQVTVHELVHWRNKAFLENYLPKLIGVTDKDSLKLSQTRELGAYKHKIGLQETINSLSYEERVLTFRQAHRSLLARNIAGDASLSAGQKHIYFLDEVVAYGEQMRVAKEKGEYLEGTDYNYTGEDLTKLNEAYGIDVTEQGLLGSALQTKEVREAQNSITKVIRHYQEQTALGVKVTLEEAKALKQTLIAEGIKSKLERYRHDSEVSNLRDRLKGELKAAIEENSRIIVQTPEPLSNPTVPPSQEAVSQPPTQPSTQEAVSQPPTTPSSSQPTVPPTGETAEVSIPPTTSTTSTYVTPPPTQPTQPTQPTISVIPSPPTSPTSLGVVSSTPSSTPTSRIPPTTAITPSPVGEQISPPIAPTPSVTSSVTSTAAPSTQGTQATQRTTRSVQEINAELETKLIALEEGISKARKYGQQENKYEYIVYDYFEQEKNKGTLYEEGDTQVYEQQAKVKYVKSYNLKATQHQLNNSLRADIKQTLDELRSLGTPEAQQALTKQEQAYVTIDSTDRPLAGKERYEIRMARSAPLKKVTDLLDENIELVGELTQRGEDASTYQENTAELLSILRENSRKRFWGAKKAYREYNKRYLEVNPNYAEPNLTTQERVLGKPIEVLKGFGKGVSSNLPETISGSVGAVLFGWQIREGFQILGQPKRDATTTSQGVEKVAQGTLGLGTMAIATLSKSPTLLKAVPGLNVGLFVLPVGFAGYRRMTAKSSEEIAQANSELQGSVGGAIGGAIGMVLGGMFLGPLGALAGAFIGSMIGDWLGRRANKIGDLLSFTLAANEKVRAGQVQEVRAKGWTRASSIQSQVQAIQTSKGITQPVTIKTLSKTSSLDAYFDDSGKTLILGIHPKFGDNPSLNVIAVLEHEISHQEVRSAGFYGPATHNLKELLPLLEIEKNWVGLSKGNIHGILVKSSWSFNWIVNQYKENYLSVLDPTQDKSLIESISKMNDAQFISHVTKEAGKEGMAGSKGYWSDLWSKLNVHLVDEMRANTLEHKAFWETYNSQSIWGKLRYSKEALKRLKEDWQARRQWRPTAQQSGTPLESMSKVFEATKLTPEGVRDDAISLNKVNQQVAKETAELGQQTTRVQIRENVKNFVWRNPLEVIKDSSEGIFRGMKWSLQEGWKSTGNYLKEWPKALRGIKSEGWRGAIKGAKGVKVGTPILVGVNVAEDVYVDSVPLHESLKKNLGVIVVGGLVLATAAYFLPRAAAGILTISLTALALLGTFSSVGRILQKGKQDWDIWHTPNQDVKYYPATKTTTTPSSRGTTVDTSPRKEPKPVEQKDKKDKKDKKEEKVSFFSQIPILGDIFAPQPTSAAELQKEQTQLKELGDKRNVKETRQYGLDKESYKYSQRVEGGKSYLDGFLENVAENITKLRDGMMNIAQSALAFLKHQTKEVWNTLKKLANETQKGATTGATGLKGVLKSWGKGVIKGVRESYTRATDTIKQSLDMPTSATDGVVTKWVSYYGGDAAGLQAGGYEGPTASGRPNYSSRGEMTFASPKIPGTEKPLYPFGTKVLFTNLRTGKQIIAVSVDTGPYGTDYKYQTKGELRGADISYPAMLELEGNTKRGIIRVSMQVVGKVDVHQKELFKGRGYTYDLFGKGESASKEEVKDIGALQDTKVYLDGYRVDTSGNQGVIPLAKNASYDDTLEHHRKYATQFGNARDYVVHFKGSTNAPLPVAQDAVVSYAGWREGYGWTVELKDLNGKPLAKYAHLASKPVVKTNQVLPAGTIIGTQGNTGASHGVHTHLEARPAYQSAWIQMVTGATTVKSRFIKTKGEVGKEVASSSQELTEQQTKEGYTMRELVYKVPSNPLEALNQKYSPQGGGLVVEDRKEVLPQTEGDVRGLEKLAEQYGVKGKGAIEIPQAKVEVGNAEDHLQDLQNKYGVKDSSSTEQLKKQINTPAVSVQQSLRKLQKDYGSNGITQTIEGQMQGKTKATIRTLQGLNKTYGKSKDSLEKYKVKSSTVLDLQQKYSARGVIKIVGGGEGSSKTLEDLNKQYSPQNNLSKWQRVGGTSEEQLRKLNSSYQPPSLQKWSKEIGTPEEELKRLNDQHKGNTEGLAGLEELNNKYASKDLMQQQQEQQRIQEQKKVQDSQNSQHSVAKAKGEIPAKQKEIIEEALEQLNNLVIANKKKAENPPVKPKVIAPAQVHDGKLSNQQVMGHLVKAPTTPTKTVVAVTQKNKDGSKVITVSHPVSELDITYTLVNLFDSPSDSSAIMEGSYNWD